MMESIQLAQMLADLGELNAAVGRKLIPLSSPRAPEQTSDALQ